MSSDKTIYDLEVERSDALEKYRESGDFDDREEWVDAEHRVIDEFGGITGHYREGPKSLK
ncbi:hypothetical protein [Marinobacter subterrani]|uniref:Uncharacterized protein n=1 Tax=Marinobacter subterrani TaxID=1658765 RepID=A0A0J7JDU1_9GAMM|nr:hypothetical protein [Marinobacter subterrani]KMQ76292.1 hypothetical protein Msub_12503 [Marinobacter subterrani]